MNGSLVADISTVRSLCRRWNRTISGLVEAEAELHKLSDTAGEEQLRDWDRQVENAQMNRIGDPSSMDIFEAESPKG